MQKFMCNVCGKLHGLFNEAALCHPDVVVKEFPDLPDRAAELLRAPVQSEHPCPDCNGDGLCLYKDGMQECVRCMGSGKDNRSDGG